MDLNTWILFCIAEFALCLSPGPAVIYVFTQGISRGFKTSLAANAGIITGNTIYFVISATSLGALLVATESIVVVVKWAGAAYLIFIGLRTFFSRESCLVPTEVKPQHLGITLFNGMVLQLANPKNLVFFLAILPQFVNLGAPIIPQIAILGISSIVIELVVLMFYGGFGSKIEYWSRNRSITHYFDRIGGAALVAIGAALVLGFGAAV